MSRKYFKLWETIKAEYPNPVRISCAPEDVKTIRNELAKEKSRDQDWPLRPYTKLQSKVTETGLEFKLSPYRISEYTGMAIKRSNK